MTTEKKALGTIQHLVFVSETGALRLALQEETCCWYEDVSDT